MQNHISNVKAIVESMGKKIIDLEWYDNIYLWLEWYKGKSPKFHNYKMYNGHEWVEKERYKLGMAKLISEDWATLLYNDKTAIKVNDADQETLDEILHSNKFNSRFANLIEMYMALGIGATVEYRGADMKPKINYIYAPMIFPLKVENGEIIDCAFASVSDEMYYINIHERQKNGSYLITNKYYRFDRSNKPDEQIKKGVKGSYISPIKMFQIYKPCIVNNIDIFSPFGVSVYGNALDRIMAVDLVYDSFKNEFSLGKKRIFISEDLIDFKPTLQTDKDGNPINIPVFDNNDTEFYSIPGDEESTEKIKEVNSTLRITDHINGLQSALNILSDACGLGNDRYNFSEGNVYTNSTQVISTQSKLYKTLLKHEKELRYSMIELVKAVMYLQTGSEYNQEITIDFDDSIIEDSAETQRRALLELNAGVIDPVEYISQVYKYTEDQSLEFYNKMQSRMPKEEIEEVEGA